MFNRLRSRFSVAGFSQPEGARRAKDLQDELAFRCWNRNPVVQWDPARRLMAVEFELDIAEPDTRDILVLVQHHELCDCLHRGRTVPGPIAIEIVDSWIEARSGEPLHRSA